MKNLILVFLGGGTGSILRYLVVKYLNDAPTGFPLGTFTVNVLGSLLIGVILGLASKSQIFSQHQVIFLATGFCGGFTTFSAFSFENHMLLKNEAFGVFAFYSIGSFVIGFLAVFLGVFLASLL